MEGFTKEKSFLGSATRSRIRFELLFQDAVLFMQERLTICGSIKEFRWYRG